MQNKKHKKVKTWIDEGAIPHLLFSGAPGVGKTNTGKDTIKQLEIDDFDVLEINASEKIQLTQYVIRSQALCKQCHLVTSR